MNAIMKAFNDLAEIDPEMKELLEEANDLHKKMENRKTALEMEAREKRLKAEKERRSSAAAKLKQNKMWKWKVVDASGWSYYTGIAFSDNIDVIYDNLRTTYPDAVSCKVTEIDEVTQIICINEHHE